MAKEKVTTVDESAALEKPEKTSVKYSKLSIFESQVNLDILKGLNFWAKFLAILMFIGAGFLIISGIFLLLVLIGVFYIAFGVFYIFLGIKLWQSAETIHKLDSAKTQEEFNQISMAGFGKLRTYFKMIGIYSIVAMVVGFISLIFAIGYFTFATQSFDKGFRGQSTIPSQTSPIYPRDRN
jgi:Family of unknown function (DUF5362)